MLTTDGTSDWNIEIAMTSPRLGFVVRLLRNRSASPVFLGWITPGRKLLEPEYRYDV
jgi:hypothetical protein